jgi:subtilisin family serine protease
VILLKTSAFAEGIRYLTQLTLGGTPIQVVSMSMGGAPSKSWADAVNDAYMAGITIVTAAGNNFNGLPTLHVIYPARFGRVIAACGVTYDFAPYYTKLVAEMQGNFGPSRHMDKALAAFTPNTPWASTGSGTIKFSGAGTSSATPQIAAAAAIYYRKHHKKVDALQPWQRVEAIRNALYSSALRKIKPGFDSYQKYFGNGIVQANAALSVPVNSSLPMTPEDSVPWFPIPDTIFKKVPNAEQQARLEMFNTELSQLVFSHPELSAIIYNDEKEYERIGKKKWNSFVKAVIEHPDTSVTLRKFLKEKYKKNI